MNMLLPKNPRVKDRKYLDSYRDTECEACGVNDGSVCGAHVKWGEHSGLSRKPHDYLTVGLCWNCHLGPDGQEANPGAEWWFENVFKPMLKKRYEEWKYD